MDQYAGLKTQIEQRASERLIDLLADRDAKRRLSSITYTGTRELEWDDLFTEMDWLVQDLIPTSGVVFGVGRPNLGKTFVFGVDLVCNVALGRPWLGKETKACKVLMVLGEGLSGLGGRLRAWCSRQGVDPADIRDQLVIVDGANLSADPSLQTLREIANREEVGLIVFDTYAATSGVADEDDSSLNQTVVNAAREIRPQAAVLFIHHPTKSTEKSDSPILRGSGALAGTADTIMTMYRDTDFAQATPGINTWFAISTMPSHGGKSRHSKNETVRGLRLDSEGDSAVLIQAAAKPAQASKSSARVTEHLTDGMTMPEYMAAAGISSKSTAQADLTTFAEKIHDTKPQRWQHKES